MVKRIKLIVLIFITSIKIFAQNIDDSLVFFSDLKFHSDFEKQAINNFVFHLTDTFNMFLAIDKEITYEKSRIYYNIYQSVYNEFEHKKVSSKDLDKKIKLVYGIIQNSFLKRYTKIEFLPITFQNGSYNCVSASILYSIVFDELKIPYTIMVSSNHVYLIASPSDNPVVIETASPGVEKATFKKDFTNQFAPYFKDSKSISEDEYSIQVVEATKGVDSRNENKADFFNLPGFQYYNLAMTKLMSGELEETYHLLQKAYFFYPARQVRIFLHSSLLILLENCTFKEVSEIDYLAHLLRFKDENADYIPRIFANIISYYLQNKDKEAYCDSLFNRLMPQISDKQIKDKIAFNYYYLLSKKLRTSQNPEYYAYTALKIIPYSKDALDNFELAIQKKYKQIYDNQELWDTIQALKQRYDMDMTKRLFYEYEMIANLRFAFDYYKDKKPELGESYLQKFEKDLIITPISNRELMIKIVDAYRVKSEYYSGINKTREKEALEKGLKYVPNSTILKALMEEKGYK